MVMIKSETSTPTWVPEGYRKLGWHAGFDVLIGPMYYKKDESGEFKFISKILEVVSICIKIKNSTFLVDHNSCI